MYKYALAILLVLIVVATAYIINACPCERAPGLWLTGENVAAPITEWSFANDAPLCQIEVRSWRPHSVNLNCMSTGPELFISCSRCENKSWSNTALKNPLGKIRIEGKLYPVSFERIVIPARLDIAWQARARKLNRDAGQRPDHWWSFQLTSPAT